MYGLSLRQTCIQVDAFYLNLNTVGFMTNFQLVQFKLINRFSGSSESAFVCMPGF